MIELINLPYQAKWDINSNIKILRIPKDLTQNDFQKACRNSYRYYKKNTNYITFFLEEIEKIEFLSTLNFKNIAVRVKIDQAKEFYKFKGLQKYFKKFDTIEVILDKKINQNLAEDIKKIISLENNIIIRLEQEFLKSLSKQELNELYEEIAFDIQTLSRVYPFISLVRYLYLYKTNTAMKRTLWRFFQEEIGLFFYVDEKQRVTLSKRFTKENLFFGKIDDPLKSLENSTFYKEVLDLPKEVFFKYDECSMCDVYFLCNTNLKFHDEKYDCSGIQKIINNFKEDLDDIIQLEKVEAI